MASVKDSCVARNAFFKAPAEWSTSDAAVSACQKPIEGIRKTARACWRCARRRANSITLQRWRCSNTASSPLCVRVGVDFVMTYLRF